VASFDFDPTRIERPPDWGQGRPPSTAQIREQFDDAGSFTLGVEEELMLIDPETFDLAPAAERILALTEGDPRFAREVRQAQLEIVTPVCATVARCCEELRSARALLVERLAGEVRLAAAGTHPLSIDWGAAADDARYRALLKEYSLLAVQGAPCGLHIHVAVGGADRTLAVFNAARSFLPEIGALAANSPYLAGVETGLCSIRPKLMEVTPRTGVPPAFSTWDELAQFVSWGCEGGLFPDSSYIWWDLRPHPQHGTLELRIADAQSRLADVGAIVALFQSLIAHLADRWDAGEPLPVHRSHRIRENAWRGLRYGVRGLLVDLDSGRPSPTRERLAALFEELTPTARRLGCDDELLAGQALLAGNGADRQRYVASTRGLGQLVPWLVSETETLEPDG
jgi:glutamate---cysteine ligase / carboxylate-amine ligase